MLDNKFFNFFQKIKRSNEKDSQSSESFMIVGLGNPGKEYQKNRHNIGFMAIDKIAKEFGLENKKVKSKAIVLEGKYDNRKIVLVKPQTFMNLSGHSVRPLVNFYKISPEFLLVIHD
ncbi:MAG TPA: aminoacyl-tRNA hydrolase, partial [Anaerolineaceae bacterium]|nr:aminoacyl-tRNA hydrolase [Anaerolineaceae bacterium]